MNDAIVKLREQLVALSKDPIGTRNLLDKLADEEILQANAESPFHVGEKDIEQTKDYDFYKVCKVKNGYLLQYKGGYSILVNDNLLSPCSALQSLLDGVPKDVKDESEKEDYEIANLAIEGVFRLPMYVFSNPAVMFTLAEIGLKYQLLLQQMSEVPAPDSDNPEFDKFIVQMNELLENLATGLEKEGKEYEKRMGYGKEEQSSGKTENESKGESDA